MRVDGDAAVRARARVEIEEFGVFIAASFDRFPLVPRGDEDQDWIDFLEHKLGVNDEIIGQIMDGTSRACMWIPPPLLFFPEHRGARAC